MAQGNYNAEAGDITGGGVGKLRYRNRGEKGLCLAWAGIIWKWNIWYGEY